MTRPLKILHIATHNGVYRGGAVQLCRMATGLKRRGHEVRVVAAVHAADPPEVREGDRETWEPLEGQGIPVDFLNYAGVPGVLRLRRYLARHDFDVVHAHRDDALVAAWGATFGWKRPALVAQRGTTGKSPFLPRRAFASARVRAVVCVAKAVKDALVEMSGADAAKVHVVYGSVDLERFTPRERNAGLLEELKLPADSIVMGSLSAFRGKKGFDFLIPALAEAMKEEPRLQGVFLGQNVERRVRKLAIRHGIEDRCRFLGHQPDVAPWLSIMDFTVVAATRREGLSGVLRESLAAGVPVISTNCSGNGEIVRDGETGLLVPARKPKALSRAILRACREPEAMRAMAVRGRSWVRDHCSIDAQTGAVEAIYDSVLNEAR